MSVWLLLFWFNAGGECLKTVEFSDQSSCQAALAQMLPLVRGNGICVAKGSGK